MHQPEVARPDLARLALLLLALVLLVPVARAARVGVIAGLFLVEFLTAGDVPALSSVTPVPRASPLAIPQATADVYTLGGRAARTGLVLVHGLTPDGKDDPRLVQAAQLLARVGFEVAVPTIPGLTELRLRPEDRQPVAATLAALSRPSILVGVSVGAGVGLLGAADSVPPDLIVSLGGYASAVELIRFHLTGHYGFGEIRGHQPREPALIELFLRANVDLLDASARRVLAAASPDEIAAALAALSPELQALLAALSPERVVHRLPSRLVLVHGRDDPAVPYTETLRLAAARPEATRVVLVGLIEHVEGATGATRWAALRDLVRLWSVAYQLVTRA